MGCVSVSSNDWKMGTFWAKKKNYIQDNKWLPLIVHMSDAAETARLLWHHWLPSGTKRRIARGLNLVEEYGVDYDDAALPCFMFLAAVHDLGKAIPAFQVKLGPQELDEQLRRQLIDAGLPLPDYFHPKAARHFWASQVILEKDGFSRGLAGILGGHHGQPPNIIQLHHLKTAYRKELGWEQGQEVWADLQDRLLTFALELSRVSKDEARSWEPDFGAQVLLCGLVIMADWIVSNETLFPYIDLSGSAKSPGERTETAWKGLDLPECWNPDNIWESVGSGLYEIRFDIEQPRPIQETMLEIMDNGTSPGIVILEAPMGEGKTEAALVAAEILAERTKRSGIFFALPTQATANGLFERICSWIGRLEDGTKHAVHLAHGKADLNELYDQFKKETQEFGGSWRLGEESEETGDDAIVVHEWFSRYGRKKGILADFVIGTIDQVLMAALKQKHLALRHLGLANKVVILDECHAYDAYMSQYLYKVLSWLGYYGVPVVVLSATLPGAKRKELIETYLNQEKGPVMEYDPIFDLEKPEPSPLPAWATTLDYPILTYSKGETIEQKVVEGKQRSLDVNLKILSGDDQIAVVLADLLGEGGCAGIIVNTVRRAQEIAASLKQVYGEEVRLLHSRFLAIDRSRMEKDLFDRLGVDGAKKGKRPERMIVVGTQVFEQSCDLDFDLLITDICPMDLLIQRIGRLHRHKRSRPPKLENTPVCFITGINDAGFERGSELIYGKYLLMNTLALLPSNLVLPNDIPTLVQGTYGSETVQIPRDLIAEHEAAKEIHEEKIIKQANKAKTFQISEPYGGLGDLVGWLDTGVTDDPSGKRAEASVRDTDNRLEVLVVQRRGDRYYMLPWLSKFGGCSIPTDQAPAVELAKGMAECSIQLPLELCFKLDETIGELEVIALEELSEWQRSPWLKGELFLVLDEQLETVLRGYRLLYDQNFGLFSNKIKEGDGNDGKSL